MGGGSSAPATPTSTNNTNSVLAPYAAEYGENLLGQASALANQSYQPYAAGQTAPNGQVAPFSALQNQSFGNAQNMQVAGQNNTATGMAMNAGQNSMTNPYTAAAYMNPYLQQSLAPQVQLLEQQQGQQQAANQGQATQAGAFGGSRMGVQNTLQNQSDQLAMSNLVGQGYNTAFTGAEAQMNAENTNQLNAANQLGTLGNNQYNQQLGITNLQNQYGGQQQQYQQNLDTTGYQNYQNQLQLPYQQLGFMSSMLQGLPTSGTSSSVYSNPSPISIAAGLGTAAIGASKLAKGGLAALAKGGMAEGGVTSQENITRIVSGLSTQQLQQVAQTTKNPAEKQAAMAELIQRQTSGIAQLPAPNMTNMADGGIVGYAGDDGSLVQADEGLPNYDMGAVGLGALPENAQYPSITRWLNTRNIAPIATQQAAAQQAAAKAQVPAPASNTGNTPPAPNTGNTLPAAPAGAPSMGLMGVNAAMQAAGLSAPQSFAQNQATINTANPNPESAHTMSLAENTDAVEQALRARGVDPTMNKQFQRIQDLDQKAQDLLDRKQAMSIVQAGLGMIKSGNPWEAIASGAGQGVKSYGDALDQAQQTQMKLLESRNSLDASKTALAMGIVSKGMDNQETSQKLNLEWIQNNNQIAAGLTNAQTQARAGVAEHLIQGQYGLAGQQAYANAMMQRGIPTADERMSQAMMTTAQKMVTDPMQRDSQGNKYTYESALAMLRAQQGLPSTGGGAQPQLQMFNTLPAGVNVRQ